MKKISEETTTVVTKKTIYENENGISILETNINGEILYDFISDGDLYPCLIDVDNLPDNPSYHDYDNNRVFLNSFDDLDKYPLYYLYLSGHEVFDENKKIISTLKSFSYIGSLSERVENDILYQELIEKLKVHPFVVSLVDSSIPYYNANFDEQKGITEAKIFLSQEKYEELYLKSLEEDGEYWSVKLHDAISLSHGTADYNVYGESISNLFKKFLEQDEYYD